MNNFEKRRAACMDVKKVRKRFRKKFYPKSLPPV